MPVSIVLIHDGARPFVDESTIENCVDGAVNFEAVCAAVPVKDTVKIADSDGFIHLHWTEAHYGLYRRLRPLTMPLLLKPMKKQI